MLCPVQSCGKKVPGAYVASHRRYHAGLTGSQRRAAQVRVEDLSVKLVREFRAAERRTVRIVRKAQQLVGTVQPVMAAVTPDKVAPVEKMVMEKKHPIREFFTRLLGRKS